MKTLNLVQGSPEWHAHRATSRNASDAPSVMGASPYVSRTQFLKQRATGIEREIDAATQARFDKGHEVEPLLRAYAERILGKDLYPVVGVSDDGYISASLDGVTMSEETILEAKQTNKHKMAAMGRGEIPPEDYWQIVQQFGVCETASQCFYAVGDGTDTGTVHLLIERRQVEQDIAAVRAGWQQFDADVAAYQPEPTKVEAVGRAPEQLPALFVQLAGGVQATNLPEFRDAAIAVFKAIKTDLATDQDFADAERTVKFCGDVEDKLRLAKEQALSQTASIDELFRAIDAISDEARAKRLELTKLVTNRKEQIRADIVTDALRQVDEFRAGLNANLAVHLQPVELRSKVLEAIKGKKTVASLKDSAAQVVADAKIAASQDAERHRANLAVLEEAGRSELFGDRDALVRTKTPDDLRNLATARIADADKREAERARIRAEEEDRSKKAQEASQPAPAMQPAAAPQAEPAPQPAAQQTIFQTVAARQPAEQPRSVAVAAAKINLGEINRRIAPLSISSEGLAQIGFHATVEKNAKLYNADDFPFICHALIDRLEKAIPQDKAA